MGFFDFLRRQKANRDVATVLLCSVGSGHEEQLQQDVAIYKRYLPAAVVQRFVAADELLQAIPLGYGIVHVLASVDDLGRIAGSENTGTAVIRKCTEAGTRLLWFAADCTPDGYLHDFDTRGQHLNVVMTIARQGEDFPNFLDGLLHRMRGGMKMPVAWNDIAPQIPNRPQPNIPEQIYAAGFGSAEFF